MPFLPSFDAQMQSFWPIPGEMSPHNLLTGSFPGSISEVAVILEEEAGTEFLHVLILAKDIDTWQEEGFAISLSLTGGGGCYSNGSEALEFLTWTCSVQQHTFTQDFI